MGIWIFRILVILCCPALVYFQISPTPMGLVVGTVVGLGIVILEFLIAEINLVTVISGILGASGGIIVAKLVDYTVLQMGNENLYRLRQELRSVMDKNLGVFRTGPDISKGLAAIREIRDRSRRAPHAGGPRASAPATHRPQTACSRNRQRRHPGRRSCRAPDPGPTG